MSRLLLDCLSVHAAALWLLLLVTLPRPRMHHFHILHAPLVPAASPTPLVLLVCLLVHVERAGASWTPPERLSLKHHSLVLEARNVQKVYEREIGPPPGRRRDGH
ncbi:hypothetical protein B0H14DRAFT_2653707 [Mycena olivaceomarginata]|nr:hypothetical protein B0H14DRAFT_2653707 [Mycena olivaceomarginata]